MKKKLTKDSVAKLVLPEGKADVIYQDTELKGFGVRLRLDANSKLTKIWMAQCKHDGKTFRRNFGDYEVSPSPKEPREEARDWLAKVRRGEDPQADRRDRKAKDALTMRSLFDKYLAEKKPEWAERSYLEIERYLTKPTYWGDLHKTPIDKVTLPAVASCLVTIKQQCGNSAAFQARSKLNGFYVWALKQGLTTVNPVVNTDRPKTEARDRVLIDQTIEKIEDPRRWRELVAIWNACPDDPDDHYGKIIRLLILFGARREEIGGMMWPEFNDLEGPQPTWTLPKERSKNKCALTLPLMPMAHAIIRSVPRRTSRDCLFGERGEGFCGWARGKAALDQRCSVKDWTVHDIRRSVATGMADIGIAPHVVEAVLNHQSGHKAGIAGIYNRSNYQREKRIALAMWEDHIRALVEGDERKVIPLSTALG
jgi:integrase